MSGKRVRVLVAAVSVLTLLPIAVAPTVVVAAVPPQYTVDTVNDLASGASCTAGHATGSCSLRAAVAAANAVIGGGATITVRKSLRANFPNKKSLMIPIEGC